MAAIQLAAGPVAGAATLSGAIVTGAAGFLGRHVCAELGERGVQVRAVVRAPLPDAEANQVTRTGVDDEAAIRRVLAGAHAVIHLAASALRLPVVYGARVRANMLRLFQLIDRGWPLPFGGIRNRRSLVYARNAGVAVASTGLLGSLAVDSSKLRAYMDPMPYTLDDGLRATAAWYRSSANPTRA